MSETQRAITILTPSHADAASTNVQDRTVKNVVARLPPERFRVAIFSGEEPDSRLAARINTLLIATRQHRNTARFLTRLRVARLDIDFYPRFGPFDHIFLVRSKLRLKIAVVTHVELMMNESKSTAEITTISIREPNTVFANPRYVAETVRSRFGIEAGTMGKGVDRRFFFPREQEPFQPHPPVVLYAGSFEKRLELIIPRAVRCSQVQSRLFPSMFLIRRCG